MTSTETAVKNNNRRVSTIKLRNNGDRHAFVCLESEHSSSEEQLLSIEPTSAVIFVGDTVQFNVTSDAKCTSSLVVVYGDELMRLRRRRYRVKENQIKRRAPNRLDKWDTLRPINSIGSGGLHELFSQVEAELEAELEFDLNSLDLIVPSSSSEGDSHHYDDGFERSLSSFRVVISDHTKQSQPITSRPPSGASTKALYNKEEVQPSQPSRGPMTSVNQTVGNNRSQQQVAESPLPPVRLI